MRSVPGQPKLRHLPNLAMRSEPHEYWRWLDHTITYTDFKKKMWYQTCRVADDVPVARTRRRKRSHGGSGDTRKAYSAGRRFLGRLEECGEAGGDSRPGEMPAVGEGVLLAEVGAQFGVGQNTNERVVEFAGIER